MTSKDPASDLPGGWWAEFDPSTVVLGTLVVVNGEPMIIQTSTKGTYVAPGKGDFRLAIDMGTANTVASVPGQETSLHQVKSSMLRDVVIRGYNVARKPWVEFPVPFPQASTEFPDPGAKFIAFSGPSDTSFPCPHQQEHEISSILLAARGLLGEISNNIDRTENALISAIDILDEIENGAK